MSKNKNGKQKPKLSSQEVSSGKVENQPAKISKEIEGISRMSRGQRRRYLDERLRILHHRAILIERELRELEENRFYRACIFGSARIKSDTPAYLEAFELARKLSGRGIDILTGGGPGLMEAANSGALLGRKETKSKSMSYGLSIELEWEPEPNKHLDVKRHHHRFSSRLDDFMRLSHSVIVTPGGIGTVLELFFTWQLIQVKHISMRPIVLIGKSFWEGLLDWTKNQPVARGLISPHDLDCVQVVDTTDEAVAIIVKHHQEFLQLYGRAK